MNINLPLFRELCTSQWAGKQLEHFTEIGSTNHFLKERLQQNALPHGHVALTEFQSTGRGRLGRTWTAPSNSSLLVSVVLRPKLPISHSQWITMIAGLAASEAILAASGLEVGLKWPNDIMLSVGGSWHKTGGILAEAQFSDDKIKWIVLGMGLNVNIEAADLPEAVTPATSLLVAGQKPIGRELLLARWLEGLERLVDSAENNQSPHQVWNDLLITRNQAVTVRGAQTVNGIAIGTDQFGQLLVRDAAGTLHTVIAGDVTLRKAPS